MSLRQVPYIGLSGGAGAQYSYWGGGGGGVMVNGEGPDKSYYGRGQVRALNCRTSFEHIKSTLDYKRKSIMLRIWLWIWISTGNKCSCFFCDVLHVHVCLLYGIPNPKRALLFQRSGSI